MHGDSSLKLPHVCERAPLQSTASDERHPCPSPCDVNGERERLLSSSSVEEIVVTTEDATWSSGVVVKEEDEEANCVARESEGQLRARRRHLPQKPQLW